MIQSKKNTKATEVSRRDMLAAGAILAGSSLAWSQANAQATEQTAQQDYNGGQQPFRLPSEIIEGSVERAQRYLDDPEAFAEYQRKLTNMLEGFRAGEDPHALVREVVLSEERTREKLAPFVGVAGTEPVFSLCMLTVLATLATERQ